MSRSSSASVWNVFGNPIFRRYCKSRLRARGLGVAVLISLLLAGFLFAIFRAGANGANVSPEDLARAPLVPLLVLQGFILFMLGTAQVAGGMTAERDEGVIDYQRLAPMSPLSKVLGYLLGLPVREWVMFLVTVPFTAWSIWKGGVKAEIWMPLYGIFLTTTWLYHLTGLVTGTVVRNRRWAFLVSIGLVFGLYTVIPQAAKFGLVFFKYLTITPVFLEALPDILPSEAGEAVRLGQKLIPTAKFYGLDFSEAVFTVFSQSGLILTFLVMLCRRWRRTESLLLGKLWAPGLFLWVQLLLLGNAMPLVASGRVFPSRELSRYTFDQGDWAPQSIEAVGMSGLYGLVTFLLMIILIHTVTPGAEMQIRGWRRARKQGASRLPWFSDASTAFWSTIVMSLGGAVAWFVFTRSLVESRWFPGQEVTLQVGGFYAVVMLSGGLAYHALLEGRGGRAVGLASLFCGIVPMMIGAVLATIGGRLIPLAAWMIGMSPASAPVYASGSLLDLSELPVSLARAVPRAFYFWQFVAVTVAVWLIIDLRKRRKAMASEVLGNSEN